MLGLSIFRAAACTVTCILGTSSASAALTDRGGGLIYDDVLNVTWLQNANLSASESFGIAGILSDPASSVAPGRMTLPMTELWIAGMNDANYLGFSDWRLPTVSPINGVSFNLGTAFDGTKDFGSNISAPGTIHAGSTASEMAHLFYNTLGNKSDREFDGTIKAGNGFGIVWGLVNVGPFIGLQAGEYISGTRAGITGGGVPFNFDFGFDFGDQNIIGGTGKFSYVWPVLDGDVSAVPLPQTFWMLAASLAGLWGSRRRRILNQSVGFQSLH